MYMNKMRMVFLIVAVMVIFIGCPMVNTNLHVTYEGNGSSGGTIPLDTNTYSQGGEFSVLDNTGLLVKAGHVFSGWNANSDGSGKTYSVNKSYFLEDVNLILYAKWTPSLVTTYSVTYDDNGSSGGNVPEDTALYSSNDEVTVMGNTGSLVKTDNTFGGWNTQSDGNGTTYIAGATFSLGSGNITLYAQWSPILATTYSVTYEGNASTGGNVPEDTALYSSNDEVTVMGNTGSLVKTDNTFGGWNTQSDGNGTTYIAGATFSLGSGNITLYAQWSPILATTYSVTYEGNASTGGNVPEDTALYSSNDEVTVMGNTGSLVKTDNTFGGWNTQSDGNGTTYIAGATFNMESDDITLYAIWTPVSMVGIKALAADSGSTYILQDDGSLWVTGFNGAGQLGDGTNGARDVAHKLMGGVKAISAGQFFAMILKDNGDLYATGENFNGQLGTGDTSSVNTPVFVKSDIASVDCGTFYTMAVDTAGHLWATGGNGNNGNLGLNTGSSDYIKEFTQVTIPGDKLVASVSAGRDHTLFVTTDGELYGMGDKNYGRLIRPYNDPEFDESSWSIMEPLLLSDDMSGVRSVSAGVNHSMVVKENNELWAFGAEKYGALGNGIDNFYGPGIYTPFKVTDPLLLPTGFEVQEVFAANNSTFILKTDGTLLAVGSDYGHMLGDGDNSTACHTEILTLSDNVSAFTASGGNTLYGKTDGTVWGAGYNYTSTDHGIIPSALGQGPSSAYHYVSFVEIPLTDED
jgi:uncharacterized repeat protein (TIGR02543 family)